MADKPKSKQAKRSGGTTINFHGKANVKGDVVGGDKIVNNNASTPAAPVPDNCIPAEFIAELQKLKAEIEALKAQPNLDSAAARRLDTAAGDLDDAIQETSNEKPDGKKIQSRLDGARETVEKLGASVASAIQVGTTLGNLFLAAKQIFGG